MAAGDARQHRRCDDRHRHARAGDVPERRGPRTDGLDAGRTPRASRWRRCSPSSTSRPGSRSRTRWRRCCGTGSSSAWATTRSWSPGTGPSGPSTTAAAPIRDAAGEMIGVVLIFRDVTEQRRADSGTPGKRTGACRLLRECHGRPALGRPGRDDPAGEPSRTGHARLQPGGVRRSPHRRLPRRRGRDLRHPQAVAGGGETGRVPGPAAVQGRVDQGRADRLQRDVAGRPVRPHPLLHTGCDRAEAGRDRPAGERASGSASLPTPCRRSCGRPDRTATSTT